ncbi:cryptochrome/photolyase family protein [Dyella mobilis]|uniref:Deoxyribodipyrimidine photo-lyase n=1 Tax=Dyella mobilis TaxID=1849582 RepID=A0ABS2KJU9_9GAMM|nr:deoxyribodipyrimidine photo-lyase [Dyella mobilis]MBM7131203.1 deoxyribodipyrimidine photo-lyase [Dyella mobilis]GLQ98862.1 deoxyribodipyrimidine photo-lyase [Dyella mobilis]
MSTAIVWFRRDLRIADNAALYQACADHAGVVPLYIHAPQEEGSWQPGAASRWWLHHSLQALDTDLRHRGGALHLRRGASLSTLLEVAARTGADTVYWNRSYEPASIARDTQIKAALREHGIAVRSFSGASWQEPWQLTTLEGQPYRVFTPYWRKLRTLIDASEPLPAPARPPAMVLDGGESLGALDLLPSIPWDGGMREHWTPGEQGARDALELFADDAIGDYATARDVPARHGTSRLSAHLHFGEITPKQIHHGLLTMLRQRRADRSVDIEPYLRELGWREFAQHWLYHFPQVTNEHFNPRFNGFAWAAEDPEALRRWQRGRTGIPLVDAGMRELWHTGWMHNRVRMVVASFLTKNLRQHWLHGARWFWDTLVDADLANNTMGWQWVAGCGVDAAPYFRVFNPVSQAQKFDPKGVYLRRWLPELRDAPESTLHEPWKDRGLLQQTGYPAPMIDLGLSRQAALAAYQASRG